MDVVDFGRFLLSFLVVIGLIGGLGWVLRRYGAGRITPAGGKGRLGVVEVATVDAKRRLVLVRRDDTEHLLLLGPASETVIETGVGGSGGASGFARQLAGAQSAPPSGETPA